MRALLARQGAAALLLAAAAGCTLAPARHSVEEPVTPVRAAEAVPEDELLDVGIRPFGYEQSDRDKDRQRGAYPEIKQAEAHVLPFRLKQTLQGTGHWGAVRVVPDAVEGIDVLVTGTIVRSNGEELILRIAVDDAGGARWLHREYARRIEAGAYADLQPSGPGPFQDLYNAVANDMAARLQGLTGAERREVRRVARLRYAADLAPYAFAPYLAEDDGDYAVRRLPAADDPMLTRVERIRRREQMFIDTVDLYYGDFHQAVWSPYSEWRKAHAVEAEAKRDLENKAWTRRLLGVAAVIGAAFVGAEHGGSAGGQAARDLMIIGGYEAIRSGNEVARDARIHADALEELGASFGADAAPYVTEVEGRTVKLSGSIEAQYAEWRNLLQALFRAETGLEPSAPAPAPERPAPPPASRPAPLGPSAD